MTDPSGGDSGVSRRGGSREAAPLSGAEYAGVGLQLAATIVVFMFAGIWLDRRLGSTPWLLLLCVFVGAGAGFYSIYRKLTARQRELAAERQARNAAGGGGIGGGGSRR